LLSPHSGIVNYQHFSNDVYVRDPERAVNGPLSISRASRNLPLTQYLYPFNAPYTYSDRNNMFLAAVRADGTLLAPSFHRDWLGFGPMTRANPN